MLRPTLIYLAIFALPLTITAQEVKLLLEHLYFPDEIQTELAKENWVGLFEEKGKFKLEYCEIQITQEHNSLIDDEGEKTGLKVTSSPSESICLISGIGARKIKTQKLMNEYYPGDQEIFSFFKKKYEIEATGKVEDTSGSPISNYKLTLRHDDKSQILGESDFFDEAMFEVLWAGDIDNDGKLDLLMDLSYKYSFGLFSLFLSSHAEGDEIVKLVSQHKVYYD